VRRAVPRSDLPAVRGSLISEVILALEPTGLVRVDHTHRCSCVHYMFIHLAKLMHHDVASQSRPWEHVFVV